MGDTLFKFLRDDNDGDESNKKQQSLSTRVLKIGCAVLVIAILIHQWAQRPAPTDSKTIGLHLFGWTMGGLALNIAVKLLLGKWGEQDLDGSPLWSWIISMSTQQIVFPLTMAAAGLRATPESTSMRRICFYITWGYLTKDFFFPMKTLFVVHHIIAGLCIFLVLLFSSPEAVFDYAVHGIIVFMEYGSFWNGLSIFFAKSKVYLALYLVIMTISNLIAVWLVTYIVASQNSLAWVYLLCNVGVAAARQKSCVEMVRSNWS